jgi:SAM-dependent methyltransferase
LWARVDDRIVTQTRALEDDDLVATVEALRVANETLRDNLSMQAAALETMRATVESLQGDVTTLTRSAPTLLNTVSSQHAVARETRRAQKALEERILAVEQRGEFIRKEMMFELRHGGHDAGVQRSIEPQIVNPEKLKATGSDIRLNLGCGHIPLDSHLNVDVRPLDDIDIVAEVHALPFGPGEVAEIYSAHMLEHFPAEALSRRLLPYWFSLLRPGGRFVAVVPDAEMMLSEHAAGRMPFEDLRLVTYGEQEYDGDFHFNMFSRASITELLEKGGFEGVTLVETGRRNGLCYEMEVAASRPERDLAPTSAS